MIYITVPLDPKQIKKEFACGNKILDNYIHHFAGQDLKRKLSACFVIVEEDTRIIQAYYTLSNNSIPLELVPETFSKKLPKSYSGLPTTLIGRFAVDKKFQGKGIGKLLLIDALKRSYQASKTSASYAVVVDPVDSEAERFYEKYGFIQLPDSGKMFLPMKTISKIFDT